MVHQAASTAIGAVYLVAFFRTAWRNTEGMPWRQRIAHISTEHYCHLALGLLYPLNGLHAA
jgi:hypothetical protein